MLPRALRGIVSRIRIVSGDLLPVMRQIPRCLARSGQDKDEERIHPRQSHNRGGRPSARCRYPGGGSMPCLEFGNVQTDRV